jgi:hypothetical protein
MPTSAQTTYSAARLDPVYNAEDALTLPANLAPSTTFAKGTVLGQATSAVNDVQTITVTATGGTFTLTFTDVITGVAVTTGAIAFNASASTQQTAINTAIGGSPVAVTGTGPYVYTFSGTGYAGVAQNLMTINTASLTGGSATIAHTTTGAPAGVWKAYASGNSDGSQTPKGLLAYDCVTDGLGNVYLGTSTVSPWGDVRKDVPVYIRGMFDTALLTGLDSTALANANWHLVSGSTSAGVLYIG